MKVAFLNSYYPPDSAITGRSLAELVGFCRARHPEWEMRVYTAADRYAGGGDTSATQGFRLIALGDAGRARGKPARLLSSLRLGRRMAKAAVAWADVVVSLTDPPLLGYWIGRARRRASRPVRWIEWTMDLYPEAFVAAGLLGPGNPARRLVGASLRRNPPDAFICLGDAQVDAVRRWRMPAAEAVVLPCGVVDAPAPTVAPGWRRGENRIVLAYAGNIGEAHLPAFLVDLVTIADPGRFAFVFAVSGAHAAATRSRLSGRTNIAWLDSIAPADLAHADVHLATLSPAFAHVCVPSKAVSAICVGRPLLFAGPPDSDTARMLADASWLLPVRRDGHCDPAVLSAILADIADPTRLSGKTAEAARLALALRERKVAAMHAVAGMIPAARPAIAANSVRFEGVRAGLQ